MTSAEILAILILLVTIALIIKGGIRTFQRNWVAALLLLLFVGPIWTCWAIIELFLPAPVKQPTTIEVNLKKD